MTAAVGRGWAIIGDLMFLTILLLFLTLGVQAAQLPWRTADLMRTPHSCKAPNPESGVKAVWIAGPAYKGKPARAFAYYGIPAGEAKTSGMVLIHGRGGTAFADWVRMWDREGFATIAVDTLGTTPTSP